MRREIHFPLDSVEYSFRYYIFGAADNDLDAKRTGSNKAVALGRFGDPGNFFHTKI